MNTIRTKLKLRCLVAGCARASTFLAQTPSASEVDTGDALLHTLEGKVEVAPATATATAWPPALTNPALRTGDRTYPRAGGARRGLLDIGNHNDRFNPPNFCSELTRGRRLSTLFKLTS